MRKSIKEIEDLLLVMSYRNENEAEAEKAFSELYNSYSKFLYNIVFNAFEAIEIIDEDIINDIVNDTFMIVYRKPLSFKVLDNAEKDYSFIGWLSSIARRKFLRIIEISNKSKFKIILEDFNDDNSNFYNIDIDETGKDSPNMKKLKTALNKLGDKKREMFLATIMVEANSNEKDSEEQVKYKKSKDLDDISNLFQTSRENIRQNKSRCMKLVLNELGIDNKLNKNQDGKS